MKIGIIGAGNIGSTLAKRFVELGHDVSIANSRGPDSLADVAQQTGATPVPATDAAQGAELVVITIPEGKIPDLPAGILDGAAAGAAFVDTGNYYPQRDGKIEAIEDGQPETLWAQGFLGKPLVKAFNNIYFKSLGGSGKPAGTPGRIALPVAGDEPAKSLVSQLIEDLGFDAIDDGDLANSWRQQPGSPVYTTDLDAAGVTDALAKASPERPADFKA